RWQVMLQTPQGVNRVVYLTPAGTPPAAGADATSSDYNWNIVSAPADIPAADQKGPPSDAKDLQRIGPNGQVIAADDTKTKPIKLYDPKTGQSYDVPAGTQPALHELGNDLLLVQPDGTFSVVTSKKDQPTTTNVSGVGVVTIDPSKPAGQKVTVELPEDKSLKASQVQPKEINGQVWIAVDNPDGKGIHFQPATDSSGDPLPANVTWTAVNNDPRSSQIQLIGSNGESKTIPKADYHPPPVAGAGQAITPDTTAPYSVTVGQDGNPVYTPNQNYQSITDATRQFIDSLGIHLASGAMSEAQAQDLIKNVTSQMTAHAAQQNAQANTINAQANVAQNAIQGVNQAAQIGQGLLQNRVTAATGALNNAIGAIGSSKITSAPAGMGANLVNGLSEWVTQLGGGQPVYDAAAAMVNQANPTISQNPTVAQQAYSTLRGMMDLYKQQTGQDYQPPAVRQQQQQQPSFTSPTTLADGTPQSSVTPSAPQLANQNAAAQQLQQASAPQNAPFGAIGANPMLAAQQMANRNLASQQTAAATAQAGLPFGPQPLQPIPIPPLPFQAPVTA
ncbi:MAG TPA: hypothetical protein VFB50_01140, partial [Chloroflexota bacterium]|nr:hypothetical protein [Chloroflexota bacterium]